MVMINRNKQTEVMCASCAVGCYEEVVELYIHYDMLYMCVIWAWHISCMCR